MCHSFLPHPQITTSILLSPVPSNLRLWPFYEYFGREGLVSWQSKPGLDILQSPASTWKISASEKLKTWTWSGWQPPSFNLHKSFISFAVSKSKHNIYGLLGPKCSIYQTFWHQINSHPATFTYSLSWTKLTTIFNPLKTHSCHMLCWQIVRIVTQNAC